MAQENASKSTEPKVAAYDAMCVSAYTLHMLGWGNTQIGQVFGKDQSTIWRWIKLVKESGDFDVSGLPTERMALDRLLTMVPDALNRYHQEILDKSDPRGHLAARDVLVAIRAVKDKIEVEHSDRTDKSDSELIAEVERVIARRAGAGNGSSAGTEEA